MVESTETGVLTLNWWFCNINTKNSARPPVIASLSQPDSTLLSTDCFSVLQIRFVAVIERLLLIRNQCKTPTHEAAFSSPSADRGGTFSLTSLTLALCGCISLRGGSNPYSCHIDSQVFSGLQQIYEPLLGSAAV